MVKIVIAASGSRGEVQPYAALAITLKERGHDVAIATETRMKSLVVDDFGLEYRHLVGDPTGLLWEPYAQEALKNGSFLKLMSMTKEWDNQFDRDEILQSYVTACDGAELIIGANLTLTQTYCVSEYMKCSWLPMILQPTLPTSEFPLWIVPTWLHCFTCLNKWFYISVMKALWSNEKAYINAWRKDQLKLPPLTNPSGMMGIIDELKPPIIIASSPLMCGPKQQVPKDYPSNAYVYGFSFVTTKDEDINPELKNFVNNSSSSSSNDQQQQKLIYFGFGSMPAPRPEELIEIALGTCQELNCKGILIAGWSGIDKCESIIQQKAAEGTLHITKSAPHDWLFPRVSCIVHHCGIGTTAAALRSGVPQIPCPVMLDQPHNAKIIHRLGVAPDILPFSKLSIKSLVPLIKLATHKKEEEEGINNTYQNCAKNCAEQIRNESSTCLEKYCTIIEDYVQQNSSTV